MGGGLLLVGKATVCSLADEQTAAAERRLNKETEVFRQVIGYWLLRLMFIGYGLLVIES